MKEIGLIFDLDQTLVDSSLSEHFRQKRNWSSVYQQIPNYTLYIGISEVLLYLSEQKIPYCIVTSSPASYCLKVCEFWNINSSICVCYHDTPTGQKKPHPAPILLAIKKLGVASDNILSFGDRDIDIVASNKAKVKAVACLWGAANKESLLAVKPPFVIHNPVEIITLIEDFKKTIL